MNPQYTRKNCHTDSVDGCQNEGQFMVKENKAI